MCGFGQKNSLLPWMETLCYNISATAMVSYESGQVGNEAALRKLYHVW